MADIDDNRFSPPKAELADPAPLPGETPLASRWARFGAVCIDGVFGMFVTYGLMFATGNDYFGQVARMGDNVDFRAVYGGMVGSFAPGWIVLLLVQGWMLHSWGGTVGKRLLGIRIVRTDGRRAGFARLFFLRAGLPLVIAMIPFFGFVFWLVDVLLIYRDSRKCLHDDIADTIVVRVAPAAGEAPQAR